MERSASWGPVSDVGLELTEPVRLPPFVRDLPEDWSWRTAVRADDLVVLEVGHRNLDRRRRQDGAVVLVGPGAGGLLAVRFQQQHVEEQAIFEPLDDAKPGSKEWGDGKPDENKTLTEPVAGTIPAAWLSASSRLVFQVPRDFEVVLTVEGVLAAMRELRLSLHPGARSARGEGGRAFDLADLREAAREAVMGLRAAPVGPRVLRGARSALREIRVADVRSAIPDIAVADVRSAVIDVAGALRRGDREELSALVKGLGDKGLVLIRRPPLRAPKDDETAIELPRRLVLSPNRHAGWTHETRARAVGPAAAHELWHTRLGVRLGDGRVTDDHDERRSVRAVWARSGAPSWVKPPRLGEPTAEQPKPDQDPALLSGDGIPTDADGAILVPLDASDRWEIVHLSGEHRYRNFRATPADVERLHLSALGGWLDLRGQWAPHSKWGSLSEWRHRATLGRDHLVRVVYEGVLLPWGHRAALIKVSERRFHDDLPGAPAFLRQRLFIVVRQPELRPPVASGQSWERELPFTKLQMRTLITPPLDPVGGGIEDQKRKLFLPRVGGDPFPFALRGTTLDGGHVDWTGPAVMALFPLATQQPMVTEALSAFRDAQGSAGLAFGGARMPVAPVGRNADTVLPIERVRFAADTPTGAAYDQLRAAVDRLPGDDQDPAPCVPVIDSLQAQVPVAKHFAGRSDAPWLEWDFTYRQHGFVPSENAVGVFLRAQGASLPLDFAERGDRSGGLVQPSFTLKALSRELGPVSGLQGLNELKKNGTFKPQDFFGDGLDPLLFGVLHLSDVVKETGLDKGVEKMPRFLTEAATLAQTLTTGLGQLKQEVSSADPAEEALDAYAQASEAGLAAARKALEDALNTLREDLEKSASQHPMVTQLAALLEDATKLTALIDALRAAEELTLRFTWEPELGQLGPFLPYRMDGATKRAARLRVDVVGQVKTRGGDASFDVETKLDDFTLDLLQPLARFIELRFEKLHFSLHAGQKPDVACDLGEVRFVGALSFVESLRSLIPLDGFDDPPALAVDEEGVRANYSLALPDIAFGVFSLRNLSLGAGFVVPFVATPLTVRFSFSEREAPFLLTVSAFGGGGFLTIAVDPDGVQALEAGFEFGASLAMNFGVASGEVHVLGGFVYAMVKEQADLTGYLRIGGSVEALGIVSVSIELTLSLKYEGVSGKCAGKATLELEIEVAFFSVPVKLECERRFAGANGDPPFAWMWGPTDELPDHITDPEPADPWATYCGAFAPAS